MNTDTRETVNRLLLDVMASPSRRMSLRGERADPLIVERLRAMANMPPWMDTGRIDLRVNDQPWQIDLIIRAGALGEEVDVAVQLVEAN